MEEKKSDDLIDGNLSKFGKIVFIFREIFKLAFKVKPKYMVATIFLSTFGGFLIVPLLYLEKLILDKIVESVGNPEWEKILTVITLLIAARISLDIFRRVLSQINSYLRNIVTDYLSTEISLKTGEKLSKLDVETIEDPKFKDRYQNVGKSTYRIGRLLYSIIEIPSDLVGFVSMIGILAILNPFIAIGVFVVSLPLLFFDSTMAKRDYNYEKEMSPTYRKRGWISSYLNPRNNYLELKLLDLSKYLSSSLRKIEMNILRREAKRRKIRLSYFTLSQIPSFILEFVVSIGLISSVILEKITIGSFQLYIRTLSSAQSNLNGLVTSFVSIYENYIYIADLVWFLNLESKIESKIGGQEVSNEINIEFRNVWFRYKEDLPWIIKGMTLKVSSKENLAIVGLNGSGKSTLIKLLARFYDPSKGVILINGINLKDLDIKLWRKRLAILFQEFESYPFSAKDSIGYGDIERLNKLSEIKDSAKSAQIHEFINELPLKYNNPLDTAFDKGIRPSTGQRQRIGISRMLFRKNASVIIMDEPTSSVDPEAEEKIFIELAKKAREKILIFVTQRFSTVRHADRIFLIRDGQIIERGSHKELMKLNRRYAKLFKLQAKGYK